MSSLLIMNNYYFMIIRQKKNRKECEGENMINRKTQKKGKKDKKQGIKTT